MRSTGRLKLGELEMAVLDHLWSKGANNAKGMHRSLGQQRGIALNTVQSTLERLFRKQLTSREKVSHAYVYSPSITREELMSRLIHEVVSSVPGGHTDHLLSAFVDFAARADETHLQRLERLIAERRKKGSDNGI